MHPSLHNAKNSENKMWNKGLQENGQVIMQGMKIWQSLVLRRAFCVTGCCNCKGHGGTGGV